MINFPLIEGRQYRRRDGVVITLEDPSTVTDEERELGFVFTTVEQDDYYDGTMYGICGRFLFGLEGDDDRDLVEEVKD